MKPGLETMRRLLEMLGNPHLALKYIHVAGTNGKGATCAIIDSILRAAGMSVARYTSPHLVSIAERFFLNGAPAPMPLLEDAAKKVFPAIERLENEGDFQVTFFECLTAVAFVLFAQAKVDAVVLETGLGGRMDATNVIPPETLLLSIVTRIGLDHCDYLGSTVAAVASEKAGIVKAGRPVVAAAMPEEARETIRAAAKRLNAPFIDVPQDLPVPPGFALFGAFQRENARNAITAVKALDMDIPENAIERGLATVVWPGRCQAIERGGAHFVVDGAHNPCAAEALVQTLLECALPRPFALVAGFCGDKDIASHLAMMRRIASTAWAVPIKNDRSATPETVAGRMAGAAFDSVQACQTLGEALRRAGDWSRETGGTAIVCGSLFLAAETLLALDAFPWPHGDMDQNEPSLERLKS